jgi:hypothetical protein
MSRFPLIASSVIDKFEYVGTVFTVERNVDITPGHPDRQRLVSLPG